MVLKKKWNKPNGNKKKNNMCIQKPSNEYHNKKNILKKSKNASQNKKIISQIFHEKHGK